ncbi:MAG: hypothetical protein DRQ88_12405 [Epsilonproteobacteria bacterium]|nr:MAG: hypothetical protein DRQ88_12405 [Campylobacterota bacterium]
MEQIQLPAESIPKITLADLVNLLKNPFYLEEDLVCILEETPTRGTSFLEGGIKERAKLVKDSFIKGSTILFRGLERYLDLSYLKGFVDDINVHSLVAPKGGPSFKKHIDDRDVVLILLRGEKVVLDEHDNPTMIKEGDVMLIPKGELHQIKNITATWAITIGIPNLDTPTEGLTLDDLRESFKDL